MGVMRAPARFLTLSLVPALAIACSDTPEVDPGPATSKTVQSLELRFDFAAVPLGQATQWRAFGKYDDGTEADITDEVTWTSSDANVAAMSDQEDQRGLLITVGEGRTAVAAALGTMSTSKLFEVKPPEVASLEIQPTGQTLGIGKNVQLTATARNTDDSRTVVTDEVTWTSSNEAVARISATDVGYFVTFGKGDTTITATYPGGITATAMFSVTDAAVDRITLDPENPRIETGSNLRVKATGIYTDQTVLDITQLVTWTVSDPAILSVNSSGVVTGLMSGSADVIATYDGVSQQTTVRAWTQGDCNYPDAPDTIAHGSTMPQLFWESALDADGTEIDFRMTDFHCAAAYGRYETVVFVVGAGWCPNCPAFMRYVNDQSAELEAAGMQIVYMEIETSTRQPASNQQSSDIVAREVGADAPGLRIGDAATMPIEMAFSRVVRAVPTAYVVRKSDMMIIADQLRTNGYLPLLDIARDPDRLY